MTNSNTEGESLDFTGFAERQREQKRHRQMQLWKDEFEKCKEAADYQRYIEKYNSPENAALIARAKRYAKMLEQHKPTPTPNTSNNNHETEQIVKKIIGIVAILGLVAILFTGEWSAIVGYFIVICGPVCKWAFD